MQLLLRFALHELQNAEEGLAVAVLHNQPHQTPAVLRHLRAVSGLDLATADDTKKLGTFHPLNRKDVLAIYKLANR